MINWLIIMFTEWLMLIYFFHTFSNTSIGNPYNVFRLNTFLFLSSNTAFWFFYHIQIIAFTARLYCLVEWRQITRRLDILTVYALGTIAAPFAVDIKPETTTPIMQVAERWHDMFNYDESSTACL